MTNSSKTKMSCAHNFGNKAHTFRHSHRWPRVFAKSSKAVSIVTSASTTYVSRAKPGSQQQQLPNPYFEFEYLSVCIRNRTSKTNIGVGGTKFEENKTPPAMPHYFDILLSFWLYFRQ